MKIREMLDTYSYENIGQFRAIADSKGYNIEYNKGVLLFQKGDDSLKISLDELRSHIKEDISEVQDKSREEVSVFFDREKANDPDYIKDLSEKGITIVRWENLKVKEGKAADGFTVIDHNNHTSYTGKSLYDYANEKNYLLDGKGTQLEKGVMSDLMEHNGKPAKLRLNENGIAVFYKKETLEIPDTLLNKNLNKTQKDLLLKGEVVVFPKDGKDLLIQVDKDLNQVIIKTNKEINIPDVIGKENDFPGYKLTMGDKYLLANGHSIDNKLLASEKGYFIADVSMTADKKGIAYTNIQSISNGKAEQLIAEKNAGRDFEAELKQAVSKYDFNKLNDLKNDGYKPTLEVIQGLKEETNLTEKQENAIRKIFGFDTESKEIKENQVIQEVQGVQKETNLDYLLSPSNVDHIKNLIDGIDETHQILISIGKDNPDTEKYKYYENLFIEDSKKLSIYCDSIGIKEDLNLIDSARIKDLIDQKVDQYFSKGMKDYLLSPEKVQSMKVEVEVLRAEEKQIIGVPDHLKDQEKYQYNLHAFTETRDKLSAYCDAIGVPMNKENIDYDKIKDLIDQKAEEHTASQTKEKTAEIKQEETPNKNLEFKEALKNEDFQRINELKNEGFKVTKKELNGIYKELNPSENTKIAVEKILGIKASKQQSLGDVKLATSDKPTREKNIGREATNAINKAFSDL